MRYTCFLLLFLHFLCHFLEPKMTGFSDYVKKKEENWWVNIQKKKFFTKKTLVVFYFVNFFFFDDRLGRTWF